MGIDTQFCKYTCHPVSTEIGFIITPFSIACGIYSLWYKFILGRDLFIRGVLSLLLFIIGTQNLFFAMLYDMQMDRSERR